MKKTTIAMDILFVVLYLAAITFFFLNKEMGDYVFMIMGISHFYCFGAILFRKEKVRVFDLFRGFACLCAVITAISWLPISGMWALIPFWVCGYYHIRKVSHHELMGHLYSKTPSREVKNRDMLGMWVGASLLVTVVLALS